GAFLASADESLMLSTFSSVASGFNLLSEGSWLLVAYNLGYCMALPVYGRLSSVYSRKNILLFSYGLFMLASLACGASPSFYWLVLARAVAGLSGAGMVLLVSIVISDVMPPEDVAVYRSYENLTCMVGRSFGAPIGGFLLDTVGWRWSFYGQIPLALICTLFVALTLPRSMGKAASSQKIPASDDGIWQIDFAGLFSLACTILSLLFLLQTAGAQTVDHPEWVHIAMLVFVVSLVAFIAIECLWAREPLIPMDLMGKAFGVYCLGQVLLVMGRSGVLSNLAPYFIRVENTSDLEAASLTVFWLLGLSVGGIVSGHIIKRTQRYKNMTLIALGFCIMVNLAISVQWRDGCTIWEALILFPLGATLGIFYSTQFIGMSASLPKNRQAACFGAFFLCQQLGFITGPAAGLALVQAIFDHSLENNLLDSPRKELVIGKILDDSRFSKRLPEPMQEVVRASYLYAFQFAPCKLSTLGSWMCG
ncbi:MFS transporter, partial [Aspergillus steynii IBT 23096]